jgi:PST family polysaccharide transporter
VSAPTEAVEHERTAASDAGMARSAVRSLLWAALSFGSSRLVVFLVTLALARLLAPADFGVVAAGLTLIQLLEIALDLGLGATVVYEQEDGVTHRVRMAFTLNLVIAVVLAAVAIAAAPLIARFFQVPQAAGLLRVLFGYLVLRGASQVQTAVLQRDLRYRARTVVEVTRALVRGSVSLALALTGAGPWAIVLGLLAGEVAGLAVATWNVRVWPTLRLQWSVVRTLLGFGVSVLALKVLGALLSGGDALAIGNRLGPDDLGLYTVADRLPELAISSIFWILSDVAFSLYAKARQHGPEAFRGGVLRALRLVTFFGFSAGTGLAVLAPSAVPLLFSDRWTPAVVPTVVLALAVGLSSIGYAAGDVFPAIGRPGAVLAHTAVVTAASMAGYWIAAPYGITAVALVLLGQQVVLGALRLRLTHRLVGTSWPAMAAAMAPAVASAVGIAACALPVALLLPHTATGLLLTLAAGLAGAGLGVLVAGRPVLWELRTLLGGAR